MENQKHFTILMLGRNVKDWLRKSVESALAQNYDNYEIIYIDAQSEDGSYDIIKSYKEKFPDKIRLFRNDVRKFQVENNLFGVKEAKEGSIICILDADDWLANNDVLNILNSVYSKKDCWMTYGSYEEFPYRDVSAYYGVFPKEIIENNQFRDYYWIASHLRTYKRELFLHIDEKYLKFPDGSFIEVPGDRCSQYPMLEMAGYKSVFIPIILYVYNMTNPQSDYLIYQKKSDDTLNYILSLPRYKALEKL